MAAPREAIHASASADPTLVHTPAGVTPDARLVDPNAPTVTPAADATRPGLGPGLARPPRHEDPPAPAAIGRFTVLRELGRGGTGVVYAAYDEQLDRKVAVKLLHSETREDLARARLLREAQAMARLAHPNIVGVHEVGTFGRQVYVAMEFVHGMTLHAWLKRTRRPLGERVAMFLQAGEGLAAAHAAGLVHRDFKPANVMVGDDGRVRVLDFGLARAEASPGSAPGLGDLEPAPEHSSAVANLRSLDASITVTGVMLGTPAYMAPEQFLGAHVDARSDQFAFCVALFEATHLSRPFPGDTLAELMSRVLAGVVQEPATANNVPRSLHALLLRGLQRDPDKRWPAMRPLLDALAPLARTPARRSWLATAAAGTLFLGGGLGLAAQAGLVDAACSGGADRIEAVWHPALQERLATVARDSGLPGAEAAFLRARAGFDAYAEAWILGHADACEDSGPQLDLRMACLDERRGAFATAIDMFARLDAEVLAHSEQLVADLPRIDACADDSYLRAKVRPPDDPEVAARVAALRSELASAETLERGGKFADALAALAPAQAAAPTNYPPLRAELALREGSIRENEGRYDDARDALERAFFLAVEGAHPEVAIDAATRLAYIVGRRLGDPVAAEDWLRHAEIYATRHADPLRHARASTIRGALANNAQVMGADPKRRAEARQAFADARRLFAEARAEDSVDFARMLRFQGDQLAAADDPTAAIRLERQALALMQRLLGAQHPDVAMVHNSLGLALIKGKQLDEALATFAAGLAAGIDLPQQRNHIYMTLWFNKAAALRELGREAEAELPLREAIAVLERSSERLLVETFYLNVSLADLLTKLGRKPDAELTLRGILARGEQRWGAQDSLLMDALLPLSELRRLAGDPKEALGLAERALDLCLHARSPSHRDYQHLARWNVALALAELGQVPEALALAVAVRDFAVARHTKSDAAWIAEIDAFRIKHLSARGGR
ncbi:serine/threonine-protein kinase [Nannocystis sp.]|uniref:serine/threonine-protein kinase n=1 Tax=Nannocystis sp. TaxID=1962667 RepID=UPI0025E28278|nr:serine/threonine-protein kinase [Nannocystis sp.]MBK7829683.1 serine/threonine protein kinase [Nannocystis sp.]